MVSYMYLEERDMKKYYNYNKLTCFKWISVLIVVACVSFLTQTLQARVTGPCANCHTMHNSQNGSPINAGGPQNTLLTTNCVGCHSSTSSSTIVTLGSTQIPIVYNTVVPTNPLAAGNFYWVRSGGGNDRMGHNVYGISATDATLTVAPGKTAGCASSCHYTLADPPNANNLNLGGCQGCHVSVSHHTDKGWYRFLANQNHDPNAYVTGIESPDWEQNPSASNHNKYHGTTDVYSAGAALQTEHTVTAFCQGCHGAFHGPQVGTNGMGSASPWIRHPTDVALPTTKEYANYDPTTNYSVQAPVAWIDPANPTRATAIVMCLSCHRAHGSPYPSMLRWDYTTMVANGGGTGGCFTCHTQKN